MHACIHNAPCSYNFKACSVPSERQSYFTQANWQNFVAVRITFRTYSIQVMCSGSWRNSATRLFHSYAGTNTTITSLNYNLKFERHSLSMSSYIHDAEGGLGSIQHTTRRTGKMEEGSILS